MANSNVTPPARTNTTIVQPTVETLNIPATPKPDITPLESGTYGVVLVTALVGLIKMVVPSMVAFFQGREDQRKTLELENHRVDLQIEAETSASLRQMVEQLTGANIAQIQNTNSVLIEKVSTTLDNVSEKLVILGQQSEHIADTQKQIAVTQNLISETQNRSMLILGQIEASLNNNNKALPRLLMRRRETVGDDEEL